MGKRGCVGEFKKKATRTEVDALFCCSCATKPCAHACAVYLETYE